MKLTILCLAFLLSVVPTAFGQKYRNQDSLALENLFDGFFREWIIQNPEDGTQLGLSREMGYDFDRSKLNDISRAGEQANMDLLKKYISRSNKINGNNLSKAQQLDAEIFKWCLSSTLKGYKYSDQVYVINHLFGAHFQSISFLTDYHQIESEGDARDYLSRLEMIPVKLGQAGQKLEAQDKKKIYPPAFIADMVIGTINGFMNTPPDNNLIYLDFAAKIRSIPGLDSAEAGVLRQKAQEILKNSIYPAYQKYLGQIKAARSKASNAAGVWNLPGGDDYYSFCLRQSTTLSLPPEEAHRLGLKEVKELQQRARILLDSLGIKNSGSYGELMQSYWEYLDKPEIKYQISYPQAEYGKRMVIKDYQSLIDSAFLRLPEAFSYIPKTKVLAQPVPAYKEQGGLTYYDPASLDGKRPAVFYVNMLNYPQKPMMRPLTYHETVPGHHYQLAVQQELCQNRMFRNLFFLAGFGEGWAMYVQDLACELGWLPDIYSRIAEVNSQLFRAVRVVVDTGIHLKKWDRERALAYMRDNLGWASGNEIDRYVVWPGQACSYTIGKIKIKELRERAQKRMGQRFDLKKFHQIVLENGSMPLDILEEKVEGYIKGRF